MPTQEVNLVSSELKCPLQEPLLCLPNVHNTNRCLVATCNSKKQPNFLLFVSFQGQDFQKIHFLVDSEEIPPAASLLNKLIFVMLVLGQKNEEISHR